MAIVELEDGSRVLTVEDLPTDNGPDLYGYLDDTPADGDEAGFDEGIDLPATPAVDLRLVGVAARPVLPGSRPATPRPLTGPWSTTG